MKVLILCSGTGSLDRAFAEEGWAVTSVDIDPKSNATYTVGSPQLVKPGIASGHLHLVQSSAVL